MVMESTGDWARESGKVFYELACAAAARSGRDTKDVHKELLEGCSVRVRRCKAQAVLKRGSCEEELVANASRSSAELHTAMSTM